MKQWVASEWGALVVETTPCQKLDRKNILGRFPSLIIYIDLVVTLLQVAEKSAQIQQEASTNMEGISHDLVQETTKNIS